MQAVLDKNLSEVLQNAIESRASDIHIEPDKDCLNVRFRVDGILHLFKKIEKSYQDNFISLIKVHSQMNIADHRYPQDGHFEFKLNKSNYNFRVSSLPTLYGETVVLRIMNREDMLMKLEELGFNQDQLITLNRLIHSPSGMILITGPTGSGKTNLLYSIINILNSPEKNIITLEDPVEYQMSDIRQTQINDTIDFTYAKALRSVVRQDPDVIMLGEIRDADTAQMAFQASLIGILVITTFHTFNIPALITRLVEMNITQTILAQCIRGVIASSLIRKICNSCKVIYQPSESERKMLGLTGEFNLAKGKGCYLCKNTGYLGRIGIYEIVTFDDEIRANIIDKKPSSVLYQLLKNKNIKSLRDASLRLLTQGITTLEEVNRVIGPG